MYKLILFIADVAVNEFPLDKDQTSIGRSPENDIVLDDPIVSNRHVQISQTRSDSGEFNCTLTDLASKNGTRINGKETRKSTLKDGDLVQIGRSTLRVVAVPHGS